MHSFVHGFLPELFENTWQTNRIRREGQPQVELRNAEEINIPFARTKLIGIQPLVAFPHVWENFPDDGIKFLRNKLEFGGKLKRHYLNTLSQVVICNRLLCPACMGTQPNYIILQFFFSLAAWLGCQRCLFSNPPKKVARGQNSSYSTSSTE